jgi:hypothetical protein
MTATMYKKCFKGSPDRTDIDQTCLEKPLAPTEILADTAMTCLRLKWTRILYVNTVWCLYSLACSDCLIEFVVYEVIN